VPSVRRRSEQIRQFILTNVEEYPSAVAAWTAQEFDILGQAVNEYFNILLHN
jgi:hypothetical protein